MPNQTQQHRIKTIGMLGGALILVAFGFFGFLVVQNFIKIQRGEIDISKYQATDHLTAANTVSSTQIRQVSRTDVETADDPSIGPVDAPVTIVEFADFQCPYCQASVATIKSLLTTFGTKLRIIHRDFPVESLHPNAFAAAVAGGCANQQGKFWQYHDVLYLNQETITETALLTYASQVGLNVPAFTECTQAPASADEVTADYQAGLQFGVRGTPTWFVNGYRVEGAIPVDVFTQLVQKLIDAQS